MWKQTRGKGGVQARFLQLVERSSCPVPVEMDEQLPCGLGGSSRGIEGSTGICFVREPIGGENASH